jgi:hypothetical protein
MKIKPLEDFVGEDETISYIGIRADENRDGYVSTKPNIKPVFPFQERGLNKAHIIGLLEDYGIGLPDYYRWRSRSGCFFYPDLFAKAIEYEQNHSDGRTYTWTQDETLSELLERKDKIIADHEKAMVKQAKEKPDRSLSDVLATVLDDEDDALPCLACHL